MENFLIFSGALAMIAGLLAVIEGHLNCFASMRRKKGAHAYRLGRRGMSLP
jgi:hypothetical protein